MGGRALSACAIALLVAVSCDPPLPPPRSQPTSTVVREGSPSPAPVVVTEVIDGGGPKLCGCALCDAVFSDDACASDADCAPATPCHAKSCVAKAKAEPKKPGTMCTMIMECASIDANSCGCVNGRCALHPK